MEPILIIQPPSVEEIRGAINSERASLAETLKGLRDTIKELDKDCVDDPEDILNHINANAREYVEALDKTVAILRSMT